MDFKLRNGEQVRTNKAVKASATVIEAGDLVTLSSGLIIKAVAGSTELAYAPHGAAAGETLVDVTVGDDFELVGTSDAVFAVTDKGAIVDMVVTATKQYIDKGESTTNVFKIAIDKDAGIVGSAAGVVVKLLTPLF